MNLFSDIRALVIESLGAMQAEGALPSGLDLCAVAVEPPRDPAIARGFRPAGLASTIAAIALPLSIIPAFWAMDAMGFSLNLVSLLAITIGIISQATCFKSRPGFLAADELIIVGFDCAAFYTIIII